MKKAAIVTPGVLPVPSVSGGAVEQLTEYIINGNELENNYIFDLYTIDDSKLDDYQYRYTNLIRVRLSIINIYVSKIINKIYNFLKLEKYHNYYCIKVCKMIKKINYDYILIENNMYFYKQIYNSFKSEPFPKFIFHLHNDIGKIDKPISLSKFISKTAYRIISCSDFLNNRFNSETKSNKSRCLPNVVDFDKFYYSSEYRGKVRKNIGIQNSDFVFGYFGRISSEKGVLELIKAFSKINEANVKLMIVGDTLDSQLKNKYKKEVYEAQGLSKDNIIFTGYISNSDIYKYMSAVDCVVVPTVCEEAFGIVALECIACERPIIISNSGGLIDIVGKDYKFVVEKKDIINNLYTKMLIIQKKEEYSKIIKEVKERKNIIKDKYNINLYYKNFHRLISDK